MKNEEKVKKGMETIMNNIKKEEIHMIDMNELYEQYKNAELTKQVKDNDDFYTSSTLKVPKTFRVTSSKELANIVKSNCVTAKALYDLCGNKAVNTSKSGFLKENLAGVSKRSTVVYYDKKKNLSIDTAIKNARISNITRLLRELNIYVSSPSHISNQIYTLRFMLPNTFRYANAVLFDIDDVVTSQNIPDTLLDEALLLKEYYILVSVTADKANFVKHFMRNLATNLSIDMSELQYCVVIVNDEEDTAKIALYDATISQKYQPLNSQTLANIKKLKKANDKVTNNMLDKAVKANVNRQKMKRIKEINLENKNKNK